MQLLIHSSTLKYTKEHAAAAASALVRSQASFGVCQPLAPQVDAGLERLALQPGHLVLLLQVRQLGFHLTQSEADGRPRHPIVRTFTACCLVADSAATCTVRLLLLGDHTDCCTMHETAWQCRTSAHSL